MKLQKMQQEAVADQPDQLNTGGGALEGVLEKPMLQILDSNKANAPVAEDGGGNKRSSPVDGWSEAEEEESGRERLKKHRVEVARKVWIPDIWGQEDLLMDWIDCSEFDSALASKGLISARAALAEEGRRSNSASLSVENTC